MSNYNLLPNAEFVVVELAAATGTTELTTDVIDMAGFTGVVFVAQLGDVTDTSVLSLTADHSDESGSGFVALAGALSFTAGAADADNKAMILDIASPEKRYVRARLGRGTAAAVLNSIIAIKYGPRNAPVTQGATVLASATLANPKAA